MFVTTSQTYLFFVLILLMSASFSAANTTPDDILLPPAPEQPSIPTIDQTEVGRARLRQFQSMLQGSSNYDNNQLQQLANELLRLCVERGVNVNTV
jgi:hypothetical protein